MDPRVSVIVPCWNARRTLPLCLSAIAGQTRPADEVIVVDDASTDGSAELARGAGVTVLRQPGNRGVSAARNAGAVAATGDVLVFVDADVGLAPDAVAAALAVLADPAVGAVHGLYDTEPLIDDGPVERYKILNNHFWRRRAVGPVATMLFALGAIRRDLFLSTGGFDESLRDGEDVEFSTRLAPRTRIVLTDRMVGRHDDADRLGDVLREQFRRSQLLVPQAVAERRTRSRPHPSGEAVEGRRHSGGDTVEGRRHPGGDTVEGRPPTLTAHRPAAVAATALGLATLPLVAVSGWLTVVPALAFLGSVAADPALYRFVRRERGLPFLALFAALHLTVQVTLIAGAATGALRAVARAARPAPARAPGVGGVG